MEGQALARWEDFLAQIAARHNAVLVDAEGEARAAIAALAAGGDTAPLARRLGAVSARLLDLGSKITDTWHGVAERAILDEGAGVAARDEALARGLALQRALDDRREELEPRVLAELARQRYAYATAAAPTVFCGWCGAASPAPVAFRTTDAVCAACGARTPFEPGELLRSVAALAHAVAQEAALPEWRAMRAAEWQVHEARPPRPLELLIAYEHAQIAYWRAYLAVRAQLEPELARDPDLELRSRMEAWYSYQAEYEEAWVRAGRPRAALG